MVEIVWTAYALEDFQSIYDYIAQDSPTYAGRLVDKIVNRTDILVDHPEIGRIVPEFKNELIRELIEGNYRIIYHIVSITDIGIIRIHHSSRLLNNFI